MRNFVFVLIIIYPKYLEANILYESSACITHDNQPGTCKKLHECPEAFQALKLYKYHDFKRCSFLNFTEIVCCAEVSVLRSVDLRRVSKKACDFYYPDKDPFTPLVFGGEDAEDGQFPFVVALAVYRADNKKFEFVCGGSLISKKFILTAAHCASRHGDNLAIARLGVTKIPSIVTKINKTTDYNVTGIYGHEIYKGRSRHNDIALVKLKKSVRFGPNIKPACLPTTSVDHLKPVHVLGWGANDKNDNRKEQLQVAQLSLFPLKNCSAFFQRHNKKLQNHLCTISNKSDACVGDSGGPLTYNESDVPVIVGIISYGETGCFAGRPTVYTDVYQYLDYIERIVWPSGTLQN